MTNNRGRGIHEEAQKESLERQRSENEDEVVKTEGEKISVNEEMVNFVEDCRKRMIRLAFRSSQGCL